MPLVVKSSTRGDLVLIAQGYNGTANDGKVRVHVLDAATGAVVGGGPIAAAGFDRNNSALSTGDPGLAHLSAFAEPDGSVRYVYGGDEMGSVWRFDLNDLSATRIARLTDARGLGQPVTAAPELARIAGSRIVLVGTGRLMGAADFSPTGTLQGQSFYAFKDTGTSLDRSLLVARTLPTGNSNVLGGLSFSWSADRGWYFDLPNDYQAHLPPLLARGIVTLPTNQVTATECNGNAQVYALDLLTADKPTSRNSLSTLLPGVTVSPAALLAASGGPASGGTAAGSSRIPATDRKCYQASDGRILCEDDPPAPLPPSGKNAWRVINR